MQLPLAAIDACHWMLSARSKVSNALQKESIEISVGSGSKKEKDGQAMFQNAENLQLPAMKNMTQTHQQAKKLANLERSCKYSMK